MNIYITYLESSVTEGGMSRNKGFYDYFLSQQTTKIVNINRKNKLMRVLYCIWLILLLPFNKNKKIFIHQNAIVYMFTAALLSCNLGEILLRKFIGNLSSRNLVIVEINDLMIEQAIDLGFSEVAYAKGFYESIFSCQQLRFIFASHYMRDYAVSKYGIICANTEVVINGGSSLTKHNNYPELEEAIRPFEDDVRLKFIYAGSVAQNRQISESIEIFIKNPNCILLIMGPGGAWLRQLELPENIRYIGSFENDLAVEIASHCDIGIVPYDESKFYYNLCYPTKASFYICAGIPFLSTPLIELRNVYEKLGICVFYSIHEWAEYIGSLSSLDIVKMKNEIITKDYVTKFSWNYLISAAMTIYLDK